MDPMLAAALIAAALVGGFAAGKWWTGLKFALALAAGRSPAARAVRAAILSNSTERDR